LHKEDVTVPPKMTEASVLEVYLGLNPKSLIQGLFNCLMILQFCHMFIRADPFDMISLS